MDKPWLCPSFLHINTAFPCWLHSSLPYINHPLLTTFSVTCTLWMWVDVAANLLVISQLFFINMCSILHITQTHPSKGGFRVEGSNASGRGPKGFGAHSPNFKTFLNVDAGLIWGDSGKGRHNPLCHLWVHPHFSSKGFIFCSHHQIIRLIHLVQFCLLSTCLRPFLIVMPLQKLYTA